jgi:hypothetical protein
MNGLDGTVGDLMTLPKSQYSVMERGGFQGLWKEARLPGSVFFGEGNPLAPVRRVALPPAMGVPRLSLRVAWARARGRARECPATECRFDRRVWDRAPRSSCTARSCTVSAAQL